LAEAYHYARFRWWIGLNLERLSKELSEKYDVKKLKMPSYALELSLLMGVRDEYLVKSDTLAVFLAPAKAVISQKKPAPLTHNDLELKRRIFELYPARARSEPQFERIVEM
jgi:hypothetical protein